MRSWVRAKIDVFDAKRERFEQPQARSVQQHRDELFRATELTKHRRDLVNRQHYGQALRSRCGRHALHGGQRRSHHMPKEEHQR